MKPIEIDMLARFFPSPNKRSGESFSVVATRMAEAFTRIGTPVHALNISGAIWEQPAANKIRAPSRDMLGMLRSGLENRDHANHICIVHGHPDNYYHQEADRYATRILMTVNESEPIPSEWAMKARNFSMIFVPSEYCRKVWERVATCPVRVVPHGVEDFMKPSPPGLQNMGQPPILYLRGEKDTFKFLNIFAVTSFPHRKGIDLLLRAWFEEFSTQDRAQLIIRTESKKYLEDMCQEFATESGITPFLLDENTHLSITDLCQLYNACDSYVSCHRGEAWALDLSNAIACGMNTISTSFGGPMDYAPGYSRMVEVEKDLVAGICYNNEVGLYAEPSITDLRKAMREQYEAWKKKPEKSRARAIHASDKFREHWSWDNAARIAVGHIQEFLEG